MTKIVIFYCKIIKAKQNKIPIKVVYKANNGLFNYYNNQKY